MANAQPESISGNLLKLVDVAERQLESVRRLEEHLRDHMAHTDQKFSQAADMFVQVGAWLRDQGTEIVRTNERLAVTNEGLLATQERIERLEQQIEQLLRALLRGRDNGETPTTSS